jgi:hypothetical protein
MRRATVAFVLGYVLMNAWPALAQSQGRVIRDGAIIWRADANVVATTAKEGTALEVTGRSEGWYEVIIPDSLGGRGQRGVIAASQVQLAPGSPVPPLKELRRGAPPPPQASRSSRPFNRFVSVNGGYQFTSHDFHNVATHPDNVEVRQLDTSYRVPSGSTFDVAAGVVGPRNVGVGIAVSRFSRSTPASLSGTTPHPFFFNQPRSVSGQVGGLDRMELGIHLRVLGAIPLGRHVEVMVFGGPSFFHVDQDVVTDFTYTQSYPFDTATFSTAQTSKASSWRVGFNGGGDVAYFFTRQIGVGFSAMFSAATLDLPADSSTVSVKAGGLGAALGVRLKF